MLARLRGNNPAARAHYRRALARLGHPPRAPEPALFAHQGLMAVAAEAREFSAALQHGWAALELAAAVPAREAEILANLASVCADSGQDAAAVRGYLRAAERAPSDRVRLPALAWAAVSAARLGDRDTTSRCTGAVERGLSATGLPYETAQLCLALARAWTILGAGDAAERFVRRALPLAREFGLHQLEFELEGVAALAPAAPPAPLTPRARRVVLALAALP